LRDSIAYGLTHRANALDHAMQLERHDAGTFVEMYVNDWTLDYRARGQEAIRQFLSRGVEPGVIPHPLTVEFANG
jgi:1,4-dihydroxy-6-naphthoate synthase